MKFSIVIPVYNCEKTIEYCVEKLLEQTFSDFEIVLMDDGSKDKSFEICNKLSQKDSRVKAFHQENQGSGKARNNAIKEAKGEYIVFCDADDYYDEKTLEIFNNSIEKQIADLYITTYNEFKYVADEERVCNSKNIEEGLLEGEAIYGKYTYLHKGGFITAPWAKAYKRSIIIENNISFPDLRRCQDVVFNLRYYNCINLVCCINKPTYNYQTPDGDVYLKKFPKDMFEINKTVYGLIRESLIKWNVYDENTQRYFNSRFVKDTSILLRLNTQNNWSFTEKERKEFAQKILQDAEFDNALKIKAPGKMNELIRIILMTKSVTLIDLFNKIVLLYQRF